jgi:phosphonate transport system substrate-binding protein
MLTGTVRAGERQPTNAGEKSLVIGLIPEQNIFKQLERYKPLADYLSKKTGLAVRLKVMTRYGDAVHDFRSAEMDGAFFGSFAYVVAHMKAGAEPLARPLAPDGSSTYSGYIFTRKDSGIKGIRDMKGKRFVFVDKATTAGYLFPLAWLEENGVRNYRTYFREAYFAGTHEDAVYDVFNGRADAGAAKSTMFQRLAAADKRIGDQLVILKKSSEVPENAFSLRKDIDATLRNRLLAALLNMSEDPDGKKALRAFGALGFVRTMDQDYSPVLVLARQARLNLATFDYANEE